MLLPMLTFTVRDCKITAWQIWTFPIPHELLFWEGTSAISINGNQFTHDEKMDLGTFTIAGTFDSAATSHGTIFVPKGFSVFGSIVTEDVTLPWTASPK